MSVIQFSCYACNQVLQVGAENAGRKAKCSQCGTILTIPALAAEPSAPVEAVIPAAALPQPPPSARTAFDDVEVVDEERRSRRFDDDDLPRRRRRSNRDDDYDARRPAPSKWDKIKVGTLLVFIGLCVMAGASGLNFLGVLVGFGSIGGWLVLTRIGLAIVFLAAIAPIVGHVFWLFVSNRRGAFGFAIATLAVGGVALLLRLILLVQMFGSSFGAAQMAVIVHDLLHASYLMMIAFYVRALAQMFDERRLESSAMLNIILTGCLAGYGLLKGIILMAMAPNIFDGGQGYMITSRILGFLGSAFVVAVYVFTILMVHNAKKLVEMQSDNRDERS